MRRLEASARRSTDAASSPPSAARSSRAGATATGGTMSALTTMPIAAPMSVSMIRSRAYSGDVPPSASTSIALIATWFEVPGVIFSAHAASIATTIASRMTQLLCPNASESPSRSPRRGSRRSSARSPCRTTGSRSAAPRAAPRSPRRPAAGRGSASPRRAGRRSSRPPTSAPAGSGRAWWPGTCADAHALRLVAAAQTRSARASATDPSRSHQVSIAIVCPSF